MKQVKNISRKLKKIIKNSSYTPAKISKEMTQSKEYENISESTIYKVLAGVKILNFEKRKSLELWVINNLEVK